MDALLLVLTLTIAAQDREREAVNLELPIVPGAVEVVRGRQDGATSVQYDVRESYPGPITIRYLTHALSERGWKLVYAGSYTPQAGVLEPPRSIAELRRVQFGVIHLWQGWWRDDVGRGVAFDVNYSCPLEQEGLHSVWARVRGSVYQPKEAARQEVERKRAHEAFCQSAREKGLSLDPTCAR